MEDKDFTYLDAINILTVEIGDSTSQLNHAVDEDWEWKQPYSEFLLQILNNTGAIRQYTSRPSKRVPVYKDVLQPWRKSRDTKTYGGGNIQKVYADTPDAELPDWMVEAMRINGRVA